MKSLKKKQTASLNTIQAQTFCMCNSCGGYCTCGGQSDSVFQSTNLTVIQTSSQNSYYRSVN